VINNVNRSVNYPPKIICPSTAKIIHRTRLFNALNDARQQAKIIWIAAPGGSGKTTLVSSYLEKNQVAHCWYQIDEDDRNLTTFFYYLGLAGKLVAPRRKKAVPKLTPEYQQGIPAFTRHFFKDISSRLQSDGLIVLDNFHLLPETDPIPALLPNIVESLAAGVSLLIISRHLPPSSLIKLTAKRQLFVIDTKLMRFAKDEWLAASQLFNSTHSKEKLLSLHHKLEGWIAGLVLLPDTSNAFDNTNTSGLGIETLDTYIAEQFLSSLNVKTSELLMKVCYMPHITATAAKAVSHISHSKKLLAQLAQKNLFVLQQGDRGYTLHPLVREYLKKRAKDTLSKQQLYDLRLLTAKILLEHKECEAAADLLLELKAWQALVIVILDYAAELHDSARIESLQRYISAIPQAFSKGEPWITFWKGKLSVYNNVITALDFYDRAYADFMKKSDVKGIYMSWYSAMSAICNTLLGGNRLITWVHRYNKLSVLYPDPPQTLQKGFIEAILLQAYFMSGLNPKKRESLQARLADTIDEATDPLLRLHMMSNYVHVAVISGIKERDKVIIEKFEHHLDDLKDEPVLYLGALTICSLSAWAFNDFDKLLNLEWRALGVAKEHGITVFDCHIHTKIVIAALGLKKFDLAKKYIGIIKENITQKDQIHQSMYLTCLIEAGTYMNETHDLDRTAQHYLDILESTYLPSFILHTKLLYTYYLCTQNKIEAALALHDDLFQRVKKLAFPAQISRFYMIYAKIYFDHGDFDYCDDYLSTSFAIARRCELITYAKWHPELMVWACQRALSLDIETTYITHFIETHYDNLPQPDAKSQQWPWPFQVYTFGGFELKKIKSVAHQSQRAKKSLTLLKILVKAQDRYLTSDTIKGILYTGGNHDKTSQLLDTQIHRLRKFLGHEQTILRQEESIRLHPKYFWIDIQEFEILGKYKITEDNAIAIGIRLQELYKGEYLPDDESIEVIAHRERYRNMYLAILFECLQYIELKTDKAIEFCQNALVLEPLSEPLYRKLISIYLRQGNRDMAEATLDQCRTLVKHHLDVDVSDETLSLLKKITPL